MKELGTIIIYKLTKLPQTDRDNICRKLLGRIVKTHHGNYTHHVKGLLNTIPHIRVTRGVLLVKKTDEQELSKFFRDHKIEDLFIRNIILKMEDIERLNE